MSKQSVDQNTLSLNARLLDERKIARAEIAHLRALLERIVAQTAPAAGVCPDCERVHRWTVVELPWNDQQCDGGHHVWRPGEWKDGQPCLCKTLVRRRLSSVVLSEE